jgi:hypothetical protein
VVTSNLGLRNDQLAGITVVCSSKRVVQNANGLQDVSSNLNLAREVGRVSKNLLCLGCELHGRLSTPILHCGLNPHSLGAFIDDFIDIGIQHVSSTIDSRQACKSLWQLSKTVKRVDIWGFPVSGHRVTVQSNAFNRLGSPPFLVKVIVGLVQSHSMTNKVSSSSLKSEFVINVFHCACVDVET